MITLTTINIKKNSQSRTSHGLGSFDEAEEKETKTNKLTKN